MNAQTWPPQQRKTQERINVGLTPSLSSGLDPREG